jgi:hypothetical protein
MDPNAAPAGFTLVNEPRLATRIVKKCFIIVSAVVEYDVPETDAHVQLPGRQHPRFRGRLLI